MGAASNSHTDLVVGQSATRLRAELSDALRTANERSDAVRCSASEALSEEVNARQQALVSADQSREALGANIREELAAATTEVKASAKALVTGVDRRVDSANDELRSLQRSLEALNKEHGETAEAHRGLMKVERQRTEEGSADFAQLVAQVRDNLEARIQTDGMEIRAALADCRKKAYEEANSLRVEIRAQPSKKEVAEVAATATEQYNEVTVAIDQHRARLESSIADFASRCREVRTEASEARLRMQRETMTMGNEITQLRAAATSLTNGVIKGLQVIGFIREEEPLRRIMLDGEKNMPVPQSPGQLAPIASRSAPVPRSGDGAFRNIEIEDLLEWEKLGKSLASRIARQWHTKETSGVSTVMQMVESKAEAGDVDDLRNLVREGGLSKFSPAQSATLPLAPLTPSAQVKARQLRG
eukprot:NODE_679_length_2842_cov_7.534070.p1 GENE.NODE_679_length_2842_cov_7.534070~~NODE_679_length_2842_cov_7.534070.p1  ORF type:complete len:417 (-),score=165.99 NODE_679_length_2842_cov_7.534070:633-1883(-)